MLIRRIERKLEQGAQLLIGVEAHETRLCPKFNVASNLFLLPLYPALPPFCLINREINWDAERP